MSRLRKILIFRCAWKPPEGEDGCRKSTDRVYSNRKEAQSLALYYREHPFVCDEHSGRGLSPENTRRETWLIASKSDRYPDLDDLFWRENDDERVGSGYAHGPGWTARASEFPEGTRIRIVVEVLPPEETPPGRTETDRTMRERERGGWY